MPEGRIEGEPEATTGGGGVEGDAPVEKLLNRIAAHVDEIAAEVDKGSLNPDEARAIRAIWDAIGRKLHPRRQSSPLREVPEEMRAAGMMRGMEGEEAWAPGSGDRASVTPEEDTAERLAAEAVDRMIAKLDAAAATLEAQLAELRRMRRAA